MEKNKSKTIILGKNGFVAKSLCDKLKKRNIKFISYSKENLDFFSKVSEILNYSNRTLIIFPQGTRSSLEERLPFKTASR